MGNIVTNKLPAKKKAKTKKEKAIEKGNKKAKEVKEIIDKKVNRGRAKATFNLGPIFDGCKKKSDYISVLDGLSYKKGKQPYALLETMIAHRSELPMTMARVEQITREEQELVGRSKSGHTVQALGVVGGFYVSQFKQLGAISDSGERIHEVLESA